MESNWLIVHLLLNLSVLIIVSRFDNTVIIIIIIIIITSLFKEDDIFST